jgi:ABC-2 type transport system ATP-binding protein
MSSPPIIRTRGLTRTFQLKSGPVHAVRGIDLTVERGEILGFLGPNGAGKTTTLRMLTTLLPPTAGQAEVAAHDLLRALEACAGGSGMWPSPAASTPPARYMRS